MRLLLITILVAVAAYSQPAGGVTQIPGPPQACSATITTNCTPKMDSAGALSIGNTVLGAYTVGTPGAGQIALPSAASASGKIYSVVDCESTSACTTGGGSVPAFLRSNGSTWAIASGGGGATGAGLGTVYAIGSAGPSQTIATTNGAVQTLTLSANLTVAFTQPASGAALVRLGITQGASAYTVSWTSVKWPGGIAPVITSTASAIDWISCLLDGTSTYCTAGQNFQ